MLFIGDAPHNIQPHFPEVDTQNSHPTPHLAPHSFSLSLLDLEGMGTLYLAYRAAAE